MKPAPSGSRRWGYHAGAHGAMWVGLALAWTAGCGGRFDLGWLPPGPPSGTPALVVVRMDDGTDQRPRAISIGQQVVVGVLVANTGEAPAEEVHIGLQISHRGSGEPIGALARIVPPGGAPTRIAPGLPPARYDFQVSVDPHAVREEWVVSASASATGVALVEAAPEVSLLWALNQPAHPVVVSLRPQPPSDLPAVNAGCPTAVVGEIRNDGDAPLLNVVAKLLLDPVQPWLTISPGPEPNPMALPGGQGGLFPFLLEVTEAAPTGTTLPLRALVNGTDGFSGLGVASVLEGSPELSVVVSGGRLIVRRMTVERTEVRRGETGFPIDLDVVYVPSRGDAVSLERLSGGLEIDPVPPAWPVRARAGNPAAIPACTLPLQDCVGTLLGLAVDVPAEAPLGAVRVRGTATAFDRLEDGRTLALCGRSVPETSLALTVR